MNRAPLVIVVGALYVLHQDFWFWRTAHPLILGFIPVGLFYHACYTAVTALAMWLLVRRAWPSHLEEQAENGEDSSLGDSNLIGHREAEAEHGLKLSPPAEGTEQ